MMSRHQMRALLLSSAALLTTTAFAARAQTIVIPGGGASSPSQDYAGPLVVNNAVPTSPSEEATFNTANSQFQLQYFYASSGRGQAAFSENSPAALQYTGSTPLPTSIAYAGSDAFLAGTSGQTINGYTYQTVAGIPGLTATYPLRATQDGALIQIPMLGLGIAIPALSGNSAAKTNGSLHLTDNDLCGIFSGKITSYGNISHLLKGASGAIDVYYRGDSSGNTFELSNHLKAVCNSTNSNFTAAGLAAAPTSTFATLFTGGTVPSNFTAETGNAALATALAGTVTTSGGNTVGQAGDPQGIGYLTPDFTDISANGRANAIAAPNPPGGFINTAALFDAGLQGTTAKGASAFLIPTLANITLAFAHPGAGSTHPKPPTGNAAKNPLNWVPSIPLVNEGYPIVGFSTLELAQCYADANVAAGLVAFLTDHFSGQSAYKTIISSNGFTLPSKAYGNAIVSSFLTAASPLAVAAAGTTGICAAVSGR